MSSKSKTPTKRAKIPIKSIKENLQITDAPKLPTADILITVDGFENLKGKYPVSDVFVQAEFMGIVIGESPQQPITKDDFVKHYFNCRLRYYPGNLQCVNDLIANPVLFNVYQVEGVYDTSDIEQEPHEEIEICQSVIKSLEVMTSKKEKKDKKENRDKTKKSAKEIMVDKNKQTGPPEIIGRCNVDLLPLVIGDEYIKDCIPLQQEDITMDDTMITSDCLPRLRVCLQALEPILSEEERTNGNIIQFSIESIYNIAPKPLMFEDMYYTFGVLVPITTKQLVPLVVENGVLQKEQDLERAKKWPGLVGLENRACYSNYYFDKDYLSIKNTVNVDLKDTLENPGKRIEWNIMQRCWIKDDGLVTFREKLKKIRKWPFEIHGTKNLIKQKIPPPTLDGDIPIVTPSKQEPLPTVDKNKGDIHLMGFLDITKLLYPGITNTRVACQLNTFVQEELTANTGIEKIIFKDIPITRPQTPKKKASRKESPPRTTIDEKKVEKSISLVNADQMPTFIVVNVEFLKPLYPQRSEEILLKQLHTLIPVRTSPPSNFLLELQNAEKDYEVCIETFIKELNHQYQLFLQIRNGPNPPYYITRQNNQADFNRFLNETGVHTLIANVLRKKIYKLLGKKFPAAGLNVNVIHRFDSYINNVYEYLLRKVNVVVNSHVTSNINLQKPSTSNKNDDLANNILYYAKEATENDKITLARRYYLEKLSYDEENSIAWFYYAIFNLRISNFEEAFECCQKSVFFNIRNKYGLILLGILLSQKKRNREAEVCFQVCMCKFRNFFLGWMTFHLFYLYIHDYKGADITYDNAVKCKGQQDLPVKAGEIIFESEQELVWNIKLWEKDQNYAETAVFLLKLNCFEYAQMALAQDLVQYPNTKCNAYYYAVGFYLQRRYNESITYLEDALKIYGHDINVGSLLAHCHYKLNNIKQALEYYEPIINMVDRPNNIPICYTNVAMIYKLLGKPLEALKIILLACRYSPTPNIWLVAGTIYCDLNDLENAEICLNESNTLDNKLNEAWKFLATVNMKLGNKKMAEICLQYVTNDDLAPLSAEIKPQSFVSSNLKENCDEE